MHPTPYVLGIQDDGPNIWTNFKFSISNTAYPASLPSHLIFFVFQSQVLQMLLQGT